MGEMIRLFEKVLMDIKLAKFSDRQIALMMGSLNMGEASMATRLICEASYRLARAGGAAMTEEEDKLLDEIMTSEYRLREHLRQQRRGNYEMVRKRRSAGESPEPSLGRGIRCNAKANLRLVVKK
jgi:hypothetical protein